MCLFMSSPFHGGTRPVRASSAASFATASAAATGTSRAHASLLKHEFVRHAVPPGSPRAGRLPRRYRSQRRRAGWCPAHPHPEPRRPRGALGDPRHHEPHPRRHGALPGCPPARARGFPGVPGVGPSPHSDMARRAPFSRPPVVLVANAFGTWLSQALANLVKARGYRVHFVLTGRELLEQAPSVRPDVVVLDADLPDLDSIEVCRTLRQNRAAWSMPVMMITATPATKQQRLAALEAGAGDSLSAILYPPEGNLKGHALAP